MSTEYSLKKIEGKDFLAKSTDGKKIITTAFPKFDYCVLVKAKDADGKEVMVRDEKTSRQLNLFEVDRITGMVNGRLKDAQDRVDSLQEDLDHMATLRKDILSQTPEPAVEDVKVEEVKVAEAEVAQP